MLDELSGDGPRTGYSHPRCTLLDDAMDDKSLVTANHESALTPCEHRPDEFIKADERVGKPCRLTWRLGHRILIIRLFTCLRCRKGRVIVIL